MKINFKKIFVLTNIILLCISPIVSSISIINEDEYIIQNQSIQNDSDPKIIQAIEMVNESLLRDYLQHLVDIGPKVTGTYTCEKASEYIYEQFKKIGVETKYNYWEARSNMFPFIEYKDRNVIGTHYTKNSSNKEILIFNAHYDSSKVSPGANDDGFSR